MPAASTAPEGAAAPGETPHHETSVTWRVISVDRAPEAGRDYKVIRTSQEWAALFEGTGAAPPEISFEGQMVVLLRFRLAGDPQGRLVVAAVRSTPEALLVECRSEQPGPGVLPATPATAGQAVIVPITDLPIRVVVR